MTGKSTREVADQDEESIREIDRRIVAELQRTGRGSLVEIARETYLPVRTLRKRIQTLEEQGVIQGYVPPADDVADEQITALFWLSVDSDGSKTVLRWLEELGPFTTVYEVAGEWDVFAVGTFTTVGELNEYSKRLVTKPAINAVTASKVI